ncbi:MAG: KpsF/GutQ family sugar-phosphate isomerase [Deltaproteobacteria bacterium]|nr:KpsF/GutQ family sugar-phosphate isomerase [Deltaproteobacteria bacterium]
MTDDTVILQNARDVLKIEAESILNLIEKLDDHFSKAVDLIFRSKGRVIVTGIGKSGLIGKKIVATLTSTGTPALFLHPVEGMHGDLGIVHRDDVLLAISNSGETMEINILISRIRDIGIPVIAFTGKRSSSLATMSDVAIDVGVAREACPFGLAPTSSSTATLAMGDALAVALVKKKNFSERDFYRFHPGGYLGQRLMASVKDCMISDDRMPLVLSGTPSLAAIEKIDEKNLGFVLVVDEGKRLLGILTDGDVRRFVKKGTDFSKAIVDQLMTRAPKTIDQNTSLAETIEVLQRDEITTLAVLDADGRLAGYIHLHDILGRGGTIKISI